LSVTHPHLHVGSITNEHPVSWIATSQGQLLTVQCLRYRQSPVAKAKRGEIAGFSRAARFRLLRFIATVNWAEAMPCLFVTLTYPDEVVTTRSTLRNKHRYLFHRHTEKALAVKLPMIWRVEWVARKSGSNKGTYLPHIHLLLFGVHYLEHEFIRQRWAATIGHSGWCSVWVERCNEGKQAALYVAKYCSKVEDPILSLDKRSYLNTGRQYGYTRKALIPLHAKQRVVIEHQKIVDACRIEAHRVLGHYDLAEDESFTILGEKGDAIRRLLGEYHWLTSAP